ncbi:CobW family GTP-binding protein [Magnetococcales bacterium HHB-1]
MAMSSVDKIPITMITGFLGSGKTTLIRQLFAQRDASARWAIIVNEVGAVPVDGALFRQDLSSEEVRIFEAAGGCVCCVTKDALESALEQLWKDHREGCRLSRVIVEPSGVGHPTAIVDQINEKPWQDRFEVEGILCLVDPSRLHEDRLYKSWMFKDQLILAGAVLAAKADLASEETLQAFYAWAESLYPPKALIGEVHQGRIKGEALTSLLSLSWRPLANLAEVAHREQMENEKKGVLKTVQHWLKKPLKPQPLTLTRPRIGGCLLGVRRLTHAAHGFNGCGWIFPKERSFDRAQLVPFLRSIKKKWPQLERFKGFFHLIEEGRSGWIGVDYAHPHFSLEENAAYRQDSRLEVLLHQEETLDYDAVWETMGRLLEGCCLKEEKGSSV